MNPIVKDFIITFAVNAAMVFLPIIAALVTAWIAAKVKTALAALKEQNPEVLLMIQQLAYMAVKAAEQAKLAGLIKDKKEYAIRVIENSLKAAGYDVDIDPLIEAIEAAIEAAVHDEFNSEKARALG